MITTEIRFVRVMGELDAIKQEMQDIGGQYNEITDSDESYDEFNDLTKEADKELSEIEDRIEVLDEKILEIQEQLGIKTPQTMDLMDSCITNRWEIYAELMGAEIVSLKDIANGRV